MSPYVDVVVFFLTMLFAMLVLAPFVDEPPGAQDMTEPDCLDCP